MTNDNDLYAKTGKQFTFDMSQYAHMTAQAQDDAMRTILLKALELDSLLAAFSRMKPAKDDISVIAKGRNDQMVGELRESVSWMAKRIAETLPPSRPAPVKVLDMVAKDDARWDSMIRNGDGTKEPTGLLPGLDDVEEVPYNSDQSENDDA